MIPFKTTPEQILNLARIVVDMDQAGLDREFIVAADTLAHSDQGVYDLMALWHDEPDANEREEIVADIQDSIDDFFPRLPTAFRYVTTQASGMLLEHGHGDHPDYKFPVDAVFCKTPKELVSEGFRWVDGEGTEIPMTVEGAFRECYQTHALIYSDGAIALTFYECCYAMWELRTGKIMYGSLWDKGDWQLTDESLAKIKKYVRSDPVLPMPGAKMRPEDLQSIARALTGKERPQVPEINPDRLQNEVTLRSGIIVPGARIDR